MLTIHTEDNHNQQRRNHCDLKINSVRSECEALSDPPSETLVKPLDEQVSKLADVLECVFCAYKTSSAHDIKEHELKHNQKFKCDQ